jgi:hypothetical protein
MREPESEGCHRTALIASEGQAYRQLVKGSQALIFWFFLIKWYIPTEASGQKEH